MRKCSNQLHLHHMFYKYMYNRLFIQNVYTVFDIELDGHAASFTLTLDVCHVHARLVPRSRLTCRSSSATLSWEKSSVTTLH